MWWALGVILLFVTASRLQWDLQKEKEKNRKPTPQMPLSEVISRIIASDDQSKPGASTLVGEALPSIREKARLGMISVWGRMSADGDALHQPLEPIPADYWTNAQIDFLKYLRNQRCSTSDTRQAGYSAKYADLHFDIAEIQSVFGFLSTETHSPALATCVGGTMTFWGSARCVRCNSRALWLIRPRCSFLNGPSIATTIELRSGRSPRKKW